LFILQDVFLVFWYFDNKIDIKILCFVLMMISAEDGLKYSIEKS